MARRRRPPEPPAEDEPNPLPAHLQASAVEDWIDLDVDTPFEPGVFEHGPTGALRASNWAFSEARHRWRRELIQWGEEHGLTFHDIMRAYHPRDPWFRDVDAFQKAVSARPRWMVPPASSTPPDRAVAAAAKSSRPSWGNRSYGPEPGRDLPRRRPPR